jgi:hypothetical protein
MNLDLYCKYARNHNIKCSLSELMVECNKHYIIKVIHDEIPSGKCSVFDVDYQTNIVKITLINRNSLMTDAVVIVDLKYLFDPLLFRYSTKNNTFAYLVYKN